MTTAVVTTRELAALLRCSTRTVRRMVDAKKIPALRFGHTVRFRLDDVTRALSTDPEKCSPWSFNTSPRSRAEQRAGKRPLEERNAQRLDLPREQRRSGSDEPAKRLDVVALLEAMRGPGAPAKRATEPPQTIARRYF